MLLRLARLNFSLTGFLCALLVISQGSQGQDTKATDTDGPVVKLLEQGSAPRQTLRLTPMKGSKQTALMKMKLDQAMVMRGQKLPAVPTPAIQFTVDLAITDVESNGDISFDFSYPKVEILDESDQPSPAKQLMESTLKSIEGLYGTATVTSRGFTKKTDVNLPPNAAGQIATMIASMKDSMQRMSSPLPEEPIGVGGKWSVTQVIEANGMRMKQTSVHTLKEIKGKTFDLAIELTQSADAQDVKAPGLPQGTTMKLQSLESTGGGSMLFEGEKVFPISRIESKSKMAMDMVAGGQTLPMQIEMSLEMSVSPAKDEDTSK